MHKHTWQVSRLFAFDEVDYPVLESEELFVRKAGEEITQQVHGPWKGIHVVDLSRTILPY